MKEFKIRTAEDLGVTKEEYHDLLEDYWLSLKMTEFLSPASDLGSFWHTKLNYLVGLLDSTNPPQQKD